MLISAIINYVNLNVASAERREKEMALRHILGADRKHIYFRVFAESLAFTTLTLLVAIALAIGLCDIVNDLLRPEIPLEISFTADYMMIYCLMILATSAICSKRPAKFLTLKHLDHFFHTGAAGAFDKAGDTGERIFRQPLGKFC